MYSHHNPQGIDAKRTVFSPGARLSKVQVVSRACEAFFFILDADFKSFENCTIKLSAKEIKWADGVLLCSLKFHFKIWLCARLVKRLAKRGILVTSSAVRERESSRAGLCSGLLIAS